MNIDMDEMDVDEDAIESEVHDDSNDEQIEKPKKRKKISSSWTASVGHKSGHKSYNNLRWQHSERLKHLLDLLMRQHNWKQASGVLSVLMKGTCRERFPIENPNKYRDAFLLLNKMSGGEYNREKTKSFFKGWLTKNEKMKAWPSKDKYSVHLEVALLFLLQGDIDEAYNTVDILRNNSDYGKDPLLNLIAGLVFYDIWYASLPEECRLKKFDVHEIPESSEVSGMDSYDQVERSDARSADNFQDEGSPVHCDSECSVGNYKVDPVDSGGDIPVKPSSPARTTQQFYMEESAEMTDNEEAQVPHNQSTNLMNPSVFRHGLDVNLFPIRLPSENMIDFIDFYMDLLNEVNNRQNYDEAVRHLRTALHSTPPVLASLLPLTQLLLLGDQAEAALEEVEYACHNSDVVLPLRLKATLLEFFDSKQSTMVSTCHEEILKKDPTCSDSLTSLITMHKSGDYDLEPVTDMIAWHLDATYASSQVWEEFASCFLKFSQFDDEDQMSVNVKMNDGSVYRHHTSSNMTIPQTFMRGKSYKLWKIRFRWWSTRHFSKNTLISEMETGDLQLLTFKAACASHLYGPEFDYVVRVQTHLEKEEDNDNLLLLQPHVKGSMKFFQNLNRRE